MFVNDNLYAVCLYMCVHVRRFICSSCFHISFGFQEKAVALNAAAIATATAAAATAAAAAAAAATANTSFVSD
jgi:hypothetical protein